MADYTRKPYERKVWHNENEPGRIPISANNLNRIEDGIEESLEKEAKNFQTVIDKLNDTINAINASAFMHKRDDSGRLLYENTLVFSNRSAAFNDSATVASGSTVVHRITIEDLSFKFNITRYQPQITLRFYGVRLVKGSGNVYISTGNTSIYMYNTNGEKIYLATDINSNTLSQTIKDADIIDYIIKNNPTCYFETSVRYENKTSSEQTFSSNFGYTLSSFSFDKAERYDEIPNITL